MTAALIVGVAGTTLSVSERAYLRDVVPAGVILFARNCDTPSQVSRLIAQVHDAIGTNETLLAIDQEGGRVQRLLPPFWRALPPAARFFEQCNGRLQDAADQAREIARLTAADLRAIGINMNCAPVADLYVPNAHGVIGDRAYGANVADVVTIAAAVAEGYQAGGIIPVVKHTPGHGRALVDSHVALPIVTTEKTELEKTDFEVFRRLNYLPAAMTAHVVFSALDAEHPASTSPLVISDIIRGMIGFDGLLISDDISMQALRGPLRTRAEIVLSAGSDIVLQCSGRLDDMVEAAAGVRPLAGSSLCRYRICIDGTQDIQNFDVTRAEACLSRLMQI